MRLDERNVLLLRRARVAVEFAMPNAILTLGPRSARADTARGYRHVHPKRQR